MPKQTSPKKTAGRRTKGAGGDMAIIFGLLDKYILMDPTNDAGGTDAKFPFFNGIVAGYEKWARETLAGKTGPFKRESAEWFADGIIRKIDEIRFLLGENEADHPTVAWKYKGAAADRAAFTAFNLGIFCYRWEDIFIRNRARQDENILIGVTSRLGQAKRRRKQAIKAAAVTAALHENIKAAAAKLGGKSKWSKAEVLARKFDLSPERIRKII
jgi:hypothetical protein